MVKLCRLARLYTVERLAHAERLHFGFDDEQLRVGLTVTKRALDLAEPIQQHRHVFAIGPLLRVCNPPLRGLHGRTVLFVGSHQGFLQII